MGVNPKKAYSQDLINMVNLPQHGYINKSVKNKISSS